MTMVSATDDEKHGDTAATLAADPPHPEKEVPEEVEENHESLSDSTQVDGDNDDDSTNHAASDNDLEGARTTASSIGPPFSVYSKRKKHFIIFMAALGGFLSPLSATIYIPALNTIARSTGTSHALVNLTLTTYMIFQGLAPTFMGNLADTAGRRPAYIIGFFIYIAACIGIALQNSFVGLLILRCLQSSGSAPFIALGSGVAADIATDAERGTYMGWVSSGILTASAIGPIIGGILAEFLGWKAIFWFLVILAGVLLVPFAVAFPETGRNVVGNGSIPPQPWNQSLLSYLATRQAAKHPSQLERVDSTQSTHAAREALAKKRKLRFPNPLSSLKCIAEPDICLLLFYNGLIYTSFVDLTASMPYLFEKTYGYNTLQIGLSFLPYGVGGFIATFINGRLLDWNFARVARQAGIPVDKKRSTSGAFPYEKARIPIALALVIVGIAATLAYGWAMQAQAHVAVPLVLTFIQGFTLTGAFIVLNVMLVDNYPMSPATATAANNLVRCLMGAAGTGIIIYMIDAMGAGGCFTFIAGVLLVTTPSLWVLHLWGPKMRKKRADKLKAQKLEAEKREVEKREAEKN